MDLYVADPALIIWSILMGLLLIGFIYLVARFLIRAGKK